MLFRSAPDHLAARGYPTAEFAAILLFALSGAILVAASTDLVTLFVGLELMVIPGYLLAGYARRDPRCIVSPLRLAGTQNGMG